MKLSAKKVMALALAGVMGMSLAACSGSGSSASSDSQAAGTEAAGESASAEDGAGEAASEDGEKKVLRVAMECAYAPYNWTQPDDSNGAVPINDSNEYAYGYDVMMAKKIC